MLTQKMAAHHSATCFLNSLFLEWSEAEFINNAFSVSLNGNGKLLIPVEKFSVLGRHHYEGCFFFENDGIRREISFLELAQYLIDHLSSTMRISVESRKIFIERIENSLNNMEFILQQRSAELLRPSSMPLNFSSMEQILFVGHTFHPAPKARSGFTNEDALKFSPELKSSFQLEWLLVKEDIFFEKTSKGFQDKDWLKKIWLRGVPEKESQNGFIPFPLHPWQKKFILEKKIIQEYLSSGKIIEIGQAGSEWIATSSMRTLYSENAEYMLKFSLNVKLTNSVRNLLLKELDRGLKLHDIFLSEKGQKISDTCPDFKIIHEPVFCGILDHEGSPIPETLIIGRENVFQSDEEAILVAALTMDHPEFRENLLHFYIRGLSKLKGLSLKEAASEWFLKFLEIAIRPLIIAAADYGVLLGSHQQNMVLTLNNFEPHKSYFRDCNGTAFSHEIGKDLFDIHEDNLIVLEKVPATYLFGYYVIINSAFNVVSSIAHSGFVQEEDLLELFRQFLVELKNRNLKDSSIIDYLLFTEHLMHKGNFFCTLRNLNENTEEDPLSIYTRIKNPLYMRKS